MNPKSYITHSYKRVHEQTLGTECGEYTGGSRVEGGGWFECLGRCVAQKVGMSGEGESDMMS